MRIKAMLLASIVTLMPAVVSRAAGTSSELPAVEIRLDRLSDGSFEAVVLRDDVDEVDIVVSRTGEGERTALFHLPRVQAPTVFTSIPIASTFEGARSQELGSWSEWIEVRARVGRNTFVAT